MSFNAKNGLADRKQCFFFENQAKRESYREICTFHLDKYGRREIDKNMKNMKIQKSQNS